MTPATSAFYWRDLHVAPMKSARHRRTGARLNALVKQVHDLRRSGMTQVAVAQALGVTKRYVQKLEKRSRRAVSQ